MTLSRLLVIAAALLSGCSLFPVTPLQCNLDDYVEPPGPVPFIAKPRVSISAARSTASATDGLNVLALSAGGEYGAYGTGFLREWNRVPRPNPIAPTQFQVITGVSTGAIIATHAYLGKFDEIDDLYRSISGPQIYTPRTFLGMLFNDSLMDDTGKHALIRDRLEPLIEEVAERHRRNPAYRLLVGTVDAYTGQFLQVDLTAIATSDKLDREKRHACYIAMVDAASAIPVAFTPIFVDSRMLVDGGLRHYAFIQNPDELKGPSFATTALAEARAARRTGTHRLFVIYHANLRSGREQLADNLFAIAGRTSTIALDELVKDTAYRLDYVANHPDYAYQTFYLDAREAAYACRKELCRPECGDLPGGEDMFCNPYMRCLSDKGRDDAARIAASGQWTRKLLTDRLGSTPGPDVDVCRAGS